jgi:predicted nucleotidyltransferase
MQRNSEKYQRITAMDKSEAIIKVKEYSLLLKKHFPPWRRFTFFGSYANNTNREDSDIDVAIVVSKIEGDYFSIHPLLWKLRRQIDDMIEPILIERNNDNGDFLSEIQKYGIEIV